MPWNKARYEDIRNEMQPGDIIAFCGYNPFSKLIKWKTNSNVTHVGVVLQSKLLIGDEPQEGKFNQVIESTSLNGFSGVTISRLSDRVYAYDGEVWWLPLSEESRSKLNFKNFYDFLLHQDKKPYDIHQAFKSAMDSTDGIAFLDNLTYNDEDFSKLFCSELVSAAFEAGGIINSINASEVTPIDICQFNIFAEDYVQIKGEKSLIENHSTKDPENWGLVEEKSLIFSK